MHGRISAHAYVRMVHGLYWSTINH